MVRKRHEVAADTATSYDDMTAFAGSTSAIAIEDITPNEEGSRLKEVFVSLLAALFERSPTLAIILARGIQAVWAKFREA